MNEGYRRFTLYLLKRNL